MRFLVLLLILVACSKEPTIPPPPPFVTVATVECGNMPIYLQYVGHVKAYNNANIRAQASGVIMKQFYNSGEEVQEGDILVKIDERPYEASLAKAEAELAQNMANFRIAQEKAERYARLAQQEYVSQLDYDQFVTNVFAQEALVKQSQAGVMTAKINLDYCTIRAPFTGIASNLMINVGNYVPVGGTDALLSVNQVRPIKVSFFVPEGDLPKIAKKQLEGPLTVLAILPGLTPFEGVLTLINNAVDVNTGTILLQALFANDDLLLWPGEFVDVKVQLEVRENVAAVPPEAVQIGQDGSYVFVVNNDNIVDIRPVIVGQKDENSILIDSGLEEGERVVLDGQINLKPGVQVAIRL
jgi:multidrug efflux system membrane fusion protein